MLRGFVSYKVGSDKCMKWKNHLSKFPTPLKDFPCDSILKTFYFLNFMNPQRIIILNRAVWILSEAILNIIEFWITISKKANCKRINRIIMFKLKGRKSIKNHLKLPNLIASFIGNCLLITFSYYFFWIKITLK